MTSKDGLTRHTIVVSDVHLTQAHPEDPRDPLWMRYRRADHHPDADYAALIDHLLAVLEPGSITLAWNGDVLDFDGPWVKDGTSSFDEFPLDDAGCAAQCARIAADHPGWFEATARLLAAGNELVVLSGNHDLELVFPGVRAAVVDALAAAAARTSLELDAETIRLRVAFRAWFHLKGDRIYLEHGSQYDAFNGVRWPMIPLTRDRSRMHPVMGKLAFKRTGSRMGYFNPYYEETFYLGLTGYLAHFARFYARSRERHIIRTWFFGAVRTALEIWEHRHDADWRDDNARFAMMETGSSRASVDRTQALRARMGEETMLPLLRELWLDRITLVAIILFISLCAFAFGARPGLMTLGGLLVFFVIYEIATPKPDIRTYDSAPPSVRKLWDIHGATAICMGHTHRPFGHWEEGRFYGNSGSWCPAFRDQECNEPVLEKRPLLFLTTKGDAIWGGLHWWKSGELTADAEHARAAPTDDVARTQAA